MEGIRCEYGSRGSCGKGDTLAGVLPQDIGEGLFKSFFAHAMAKTERQDGVTEGASLLEFSRELCETVSIGGDRTLPPGSVKRLAAFLVGQGLDAQKVDELIARASDQDGGVHLALLVSGLRELCRQREASQGSLVVRSSQSPEVAAFLLRTGLGVGQVRVLMEKAGGPDGSLGVNRLEKGLSEHFPELRLDGRLASLFSQCGIRCESKAMAAEAGQADLRSALESPSSGSSAQLPREVRGILAGLLAEKGIPPQEVKSLLEGISLDQAKSLVKPRAEVTDGTARQEAANLVGQSRNPKGERWDVRESRAGTPEVIGQKASEGARAPSEEAPAEKAQPAKAESRSYHELLQDKRAELKRPEGPGGSPHPMSGSAGEKFLVSTQEAGKTGIAVSDGSRQSEPYRETLSSLSDRMSWMVQSGIHKARILLSPPDLGRIEVELALERGHLRAQIGAESVAAKEMIDAHLNPLRQQLAELGFSGAEFEVHVGLNDRWNEGRDPLWASWEQARPAPREKTEASELTPETGATGPGETLPQYQISLRV